MGLVPEHAPSASQKRMHGGARQFFYHDAPHLSQEMSRRIVKQLSSISDHEVRLLQKLIPNSTFLVDTDHAVSQMSTRGKHPMEISFSEVMKFLKVPKAAQKYLGNHISPSALAKYILNFYALEPGRYQVNDNGIQYIHA